MTTSFALADDFPLNKTIPRMQIPLQTRAKLELLVNNLTEVFMDSFGASGPSNNQKVSFVKLHTYHNSGRGSPLRQGKDTIWVSTVRADELSVRYFGQKIAKHRSENRSKGYAVYIASDGEAGNYGFLHSVTRVSKDQFRIYVWTYTTSAGDGPSLSSLSKMKSFPNSDYDASRSSDYEATVQWIEGKKPRYIVKAWRKVS